MEVLMSRAAFTLPLVNKKKINARWHLTPTIESLPIPESSSENRRLEERVSPAVVIVAILSANFQTFIICFSRVRKLSTMNHIFPGVARLTLGEPETLTPVTLRQRPPAAASLGQWPTNRDCPLDLSAIGGRRSARGFVLELPLDDEEELYGLGLQLQSFRQRERGRMGHKKMLRVNSDPLVDTGDSHAPAPFYVSTRGYSVLVDTARYATFYLGCAQHPRTATSSHGEAMAARSSEQLYEQVGAGDEANWHVEVEVPAAAGADVYVFWGDDLLEAVQRYNLFSGGGCLPPRWGLGVWYRARTDADQNAALAMAQLLRASEMPCDVFGLEPGWQTRAYPCSFKWSEKFPDPSALIGELNGAHYQVNLWEHAFVHDEAPFAGQIAPLSGDRTAFGGLVPDFSLPAARELFIEQHTQTHLQLGVAGYKLDECDNSDFIPRSWSFPETTQFPSGLDGEQMHSLLGTLYQATIEDAFLRREQPTYGLVRSAGALAAPYPFVLYSDLYAHREFLRGLVNAGFCGMLWTPEVREAQNTEDLVRRLQSVVCSPQALVNAWYIRHPPWRQPDKARNNADDLAEDWPLVEALCRQVLELRMKLVPYLHAAFDVYRCTGLPPFRALVMDYPDDLAARTIEDQWMMGDRLMVAPLVAGQSGRSVYLPSGDWRCFWSGRKFEGARTVEVKYGLEQFPLFVRDNCVLPLAAPTLHTRDARSREITARVYGDGALGCFLLEDSSHAELTWDAATQNGSVTRAGDGEFYRVVKWEMMG